MSREYHFQLKIGFSAHRTEAGIILAFKKAVGQGILESKLILIDKFNNGFVLFEFEITFYYLGVDLFSGFRMDQCGPEAFGNTSLEFVQFIEVVHEVKHIVL